MKLCFEAHFVTDGDFHFDKNEIYRRLETGKSLYKNADILFDYQTHEDHIDIYLIAEKDANACRWYFRDLLESLICSIRTSKYWLVKDLYELLNYFHEDLWVESNQYKTNELSGNYDGTQLILEIIH